MENVLRHNVTTSTLVTRVLRVIEKLRDARARRAALNKAYAELQYLSDAELLEYGLHRSDLFDLARTQVYRDRLAHF